MSVAAKNYLDRSAIRSFIEEQDPVKERFQESFRQLADPFLFGRPTPAIAVLLLKLYHENIVRLATTTDAIPVKCMIGILETTDGQIYCTFSGDPFELPNFNDRHKVFISMLKNTNIEIVFPEFPKGTIDPFNIETIFPEYPKGPMNALQKVATPLSDATQCMFTTDATGASYDEQIQSKRISVNYVHSNAYLESRRGGVSFAPFKVIEGAGRDGELECGYGSSCVEAKLFSYIYSLGKTFDDIKGFAAYWIANKCPPNHTNAKFCYRSDQSEKIEHLATVFLESLDKELQGHLKTTYPKTFVDVIHSVVAANALPCVGCVANYVDYKRNKYSRWNPTKCRRTITIVGGSCRRRRRRRRNQKLTRKRKGT